jgi:hypothetical protein
MDEFGTKQAYLVLKNAEFNYAAFGYTKAMIRPYFRCYLNKC